MLNRKKIRLGIDGRVLFYPYLRGMARYLKNLLNYIPENFEVYLYGEKSRYKFYKKHKLRLNVNLRLFDFKGDRFHLWQQILLPILSLKDKLDLLFCPASSAPLIQPIKTVITLHDVHLWTIVNDFYWKRVIPQAFKKAKFIITISNSSRKEILEVFPFLSQKISVIYHGIDDLFFQPINDIFLPEEIKSAMNNYFLYIGGSHSKKRPKFAINLLFSLIKRLHLNINLVMLGIPPEYIPFFYNYAAKLKVKDNLFLAPFLDDRQLVLVYKNAKFLLFPTLHEGFGFPVLEGMASMIPVIATDLPVLREISHGKIVLLPAKDYRLWLSYSYNFVVGSFPEYDLEEAFKIAQSYKWSNTAEKTFSIFQRICH